MKPNCFELIVCSSVKLTVSQFLFTSYWQLLSLMSHWHVSTRMISLDIWTCIHGIWCTSALSTSTFVTICYLLYIIQLCNIISLLCNMCLEVKNLGIETILPELFSMNHRLIYYGVVSILYLLLSNHIWIEPR